MHLVCNTPALSLSASSDAYRSACICSDSLAVVSSPRTKQSQMWSQDLSFRSSQTLECSHTSRCVQPLGRLRPWTHSQTTRQTWCRWCSLRRGVWRCFAPFMCGDVTIDTNRFRFKRAKQSSVLSNRFTKLHLIAETEGFERDFRSRMSCQSSGSARLGSTM